MFANPLPCIVLLCNADETLYSYSINGHLLHAVNISPEVMLYPSLGRNSFFNDFLVYIDKTKNAIVTRKIPSLEVAKRKHFDKSISTFAISSNYMFGILGHKDGSYSLLCSLPQKEQEKADK